MNTPVIVLKPKSANNKQLFLNAWAQFTETAKAHMKSNELCSELIHKLTVDELKEIAKDGIDHIEDIKEDHSAVTYVHNIISELMSRHADANNE